MADILIQFHALPAELFDLVKQSVARFQLTLVGIKYWPFEALEVDPEELSTELGRDGVLYDRLVFMLGKPSLPASGNMDFADHNPDNLALDIGRPTGRGLDESALAARTSNRRALSVWREIAKDLKRITEEGAVAVNPETGATAPMRRHRFTRGALELQARGVPILPLGGCLLRLGDDT
jgi:hypothetical protein